MERVLRSAVIIAFLVVVMVLSAQADPVSRQIQYKKKTTLPYPATYTLRFSLWDNDTGGSEIWSEEKSVAVVGPMIKTSLGSEISLDGVAFSDQLWVQVERRKKNGTYKIVGIRETFPVVPYAIWAGDGAVQGPPGPAGPQGPPGPPGSGGSLSIGTFAGPIGTVPGTGSDWAFIGATTTFTITAEQRLTGSAQAALGTFSVSPAIFLYDLCYRPSGSPDAPSNFTSGGFTVGSISSSTGRISFFATGSVIPGGGAWEAGYCIYNDSEVDLDNCDYVNGWLMVTH